MSLFVKTLVQPFTKTIVKVMKNMNDKTIAKQVILGKNVRPRLQLFNRDCNRPIMGFQTAFKDGKPVKIKYLVPAKKEEIKYSGEYSELVDVPNYNKLIWTDYKDLNKGVRKIHYSDGSTVPDYPEFNV